MKLVEVYEVGNKFVLKNDDPPYFAKQVRDFEIEDIADKYYTGKCILRNGSISHLNMDLDELKIYFVLDKEDNE